MGCLLGKQDINDIHPDIFSVHNIDHEVCLLFLYIGILKYKSGLTSEGILSGAQWFRTFSWGWHQIKNSCLFLALKSETSSLYLLLANNKNVIILAYILGKFITLHYIRKNLRSCCLSAKLGQHAATVPVL